jgi:hypothetical protein
MASDFSVAWQCLSKRTIGIFVTDQTPRPNKMAIFPKSNSTKAMICLNVGQKFSEKNAPTVWRSNETIQWRLPTYVWVVLHVGQRKASANFFQEIKSVRSVKKFSSLKSLTDF